jgi:chromosome partitioning protein
MAKIYSILNHKGGTGKTTTTLNLGTALTRMEKRILVIDLDAQANLSQSVGLESDEGTIAQVFERKVSKLPLVHVSKNLFVAPSSLDLSVVEATLYSNFSSYFLLKGLLEQIADDFDFILIDCPPSLGVYTQNALIASDGVIIPVQAQFLSIKGLNTIIDLIQMVKDKLNPRVEVRGLLITQVNHTKLCKDITAGLRAKFGDKVFTTAIRQNVAIAEASLRRQDIFTYGPDSMGAHDYLSLANELTQ